MIHPLSIATNGYLTTRKRVLVAAVDGYLFYRGITPPLPTPTPSIPTVVGGGGVGMSIKNNFISNNVNRKYNKKNYYTYEEPSKLETEDNELMLIIKSFLRCQQ